MRIEDLEKKVIDLFEFRKRYFLVHPIEEASLRETRITERINEIVTDITALRLAASTLTDESSGDFGQQLSTENAANLCWLEGKARNAATAYDASAQENMTKALKLNPKLGDTTDVHVQLGECFWKKEDVNGAKLSFEQSIKSSNQEIVKEGKRNLSIVLRQLASRNSAKYQSSMEDSVKLAKEAIQIDMKDGYSWYILGNAYLSQFFAEGQKQETVKSAMQAYKNAFKDPLSEYNQDLHYNNAILLKFQEEYKEAVDELQLVVKLDPLWIEAQSSLDLLESMLLKITELVDHRGGLKPKQYEKIINTFKDGQLGPYSSPIKDTKTEKEVTLTKCEVSELSSSNPDKVILVKVLTEVADLKDQPPYIAIVADSSNNTCALSVYNAVSNFHLQRGDSVAIPQPLVSNHDFSLKDKKVKFSSIRVFSPVDLVVNGRKFGKNYESYASLGVEAKAS